MSEDLQKKFQDAVKQRFSVNQNALSAITQTFDSMIEEFFHGIANGQKEESIYKILPNEQNLSEVRETEAFKQLDNLCREKNVYLKMFNPSAPDYRHDRRPYLCITPGKPYTPYKKPSFLGRLFRND